MLERVPKYTLRKLSVGLASVMIGSGILMSSPKVLAATTSTSESTGTGTADQPSSQDNSKPGTQVQNTDPKAEAAVQKGSDTKPATTTNAEKKVVATNIQDTTQDKDKQPNANKTTQNTTDVRKKDTEVTPTNDATTPAKVLRVVRLVKKVPDTAETPDPTTPSDSTSMAIVKPRHYAGFPAHVNGDN